MKKIKLLTLTTSFPLSPGSVSGVFVKKLVDNLPEKFSVTVLTPCAAFPLATKQEVAGQYRYRLKCFRYALPRWQILAHQPGGIPVAMSNNKLTVLLIPIMLLSQLFACIREAISADVIHANWSVNGLIAGMSGLITRTPVITTIRGEDANRAKRSAVYRCILRFCLWQNEKLVCVSEAITNQMKSLFPGQEEKIEFVPNGVQDKLLELPVRQRKKDDVDIRLLTVGSLIPRKSVDTIIEAISINVSNPDITGTLHLTIIGDGPEKEKLQEQVRQLGLEAQVDFIGNVEPDNIADYLKQTNGLVLASTSEGRANVVLEALAAGVPVIASDIDGNQELLGNGANGLLFATGDANELAQQIRLLYSARALSENLSNNGRAYIVDNKLTWTETGRRYAALFEQSLQPGRTVTCAG